MLVDTASQTMAAVRRYVAGGRQNISDRCIVDGRTSNGRVLCGLRGHLLTAGPRRNMM